MRQGPDVYRDLQQQAAAARRRADALAQELQAEQQRTQQIVAQRTAALSRLAEHYLPALDDRSIAQNAADVRAQLEAVQDRQQAEVARLRTEVSSLARELSEHEGSFATVTARLEACVARRTEIEARTAELLERDTEFTELAKRAAETERELARDEERAQEMAREAADKLPAYERSTLFQYLVRRGFGTAEYEATGLTRRLDRWVAGLVDYARAKPGYDFLRVTPELVAAEVKRRREEFEPVMAKLHDKQEAAAAQVGLPDVLREGEAVGEERDRLVAAMTAAQQAHRKASEELAAAESTEGKYHAEALVALRSLLERTETQVLEQRARATPDARDDALVAELAALRRAEDTTSDQLEVLTSKRRTLEDHAVGLERLVRRFREANFDSQRSRFRDLDLDRAFQRYHDGSADVEQVWSELRGRQDFEEAAPPFSGGFGSHGSGRSDLGTGSRILLEAMGHVVGAALRTAAHRSVFRSGGRGGGFRIGGGGGGGGGGRGGGGRFTRGKGF